MKRGSLGPTDRLTLFAGRVLPFDERAAMIWAQLMSAGKRAGRPRSALDMIIASVAAAQNCVVATSNERDFEGLDYINPAR